MAVLIAVVSFVWSNLWNIPLKELLPYYSASLMLWTFISGALAESTTAFISATSFFLNQRVSFSTAIYAVQYRQLVIFLHNIPIFFAVAVLFGVRVSEVTLLFIPGIAVLYAVDYIVIPFSSALCLFPLCSLLHNFEMNPIPVPNGSQKNDHSRK